MAGSYSAFLEFESGAAATVVYSVNDHFNSKELTFKLDLGDEWAGQPQHARARRTLRESGGAQQEADLKRSQRFGGDRGRGVSP